MSVGSTAYTSSVAPVPYAISVMLVLISINVTSAQQGGSPQKSKDEKAIIEAVRQDRKIVFPKDKKPVISASFLKALSTGGLPEVTNPQVIRIENIDVNGDLDFSTHDIHPYFSLKGCIFRGEVDFDFCRFKRGLNLSSSEFMNIASFQGMEVTGPFRCMRSHFHSIDPKSKTDYLDMSSLRVTGMLRLEESEFDAGMSMFLARVDGLVKCDKAQFKKWSRIVQAKIGGALEMNGATFNRGLRLDGTIIEGSVNASNLIMEHGLECNNVRVGGSVIFDEARFTYCEDKEFLRENTFRSSVIGGNLELNKAEFKPVLFTLPFAIDEKHRVIPGVSWGVKRIPRAIRRSRDG